eukprot:364337-Chlamydomonas_euryale.AAC.17
MRKRCTPRRGTRRVRAPPVVIPLRVGATWCNPDKLTRCGTAANLASGGEAISAVAASLANAASRMNQSRGAALADVTQRS